MSHARPTVLTSSNEHTLPPAPRTPIATLSPPGPPGFPQVAPRPPMPPQVPCVPLPPPHHPIPSVPPLYPHGPRAPPTPPVHLTYPLRSPRATSPPPAMFPYPAAPPLPTPSHHRHSRKEVASRDASLPLPETAMTATEAEALLRAAPWRRAVPMPSAVPSPSPHNTPDALYVSAHNDSLYSSLAARCSPPPASTPALQTPLSACRRRRASGSPCPRRPRVCPPATQRPVVPGGGSTARPSAAWHRRPLRPVPIPIPVPPGTAGTPASAASSGPAPAAHPCASAGRCGAARHGDDPRGPPSKPRAPRTPLMTTQGTYWCGGSRASVSWALRCIRAAPSSPCAQAVMRPASSCGAYNCRHCAVGSGHHRVPSGWEGP